jgi:hypothetical protein
MRDVPASEIGLKRLAEQHVEPAVKRLGELVNDGDPRIALEASELVLRLARPNSLGVWTQRWDWLQPRFDWEDMMGGGRAG